MEDGAEDEGRLLMLMLTASAEADATVEIEDEEGEAEDAADDEVDDEEDEAGADEVFEARGDPLVSTENQSTITAIESRSYTRREKKKTKKNKLSS